METLYGGQLTLSTHLMKPNYFLKPPHRRSGQFLQEITLFSHLQGTLVKFYLLITANFSRRLVILTWDKYQYLDNCPPTPPLTQQQSTDNKLGLMLG